VLKSKVVEVPGVIRKASATRQPSIESEVLSAPESGRPIPLCVFPDSSFPTRHVIVENPVVFGTKIIVRAKIYPFVRDDEQSPPTRADLIVFRIAPSGLAEESPAGRLKGLAAEKTQTSKPLIVNVASDAIYAVPAEDLFPWWGEDPLPLGNLGLRCRGQDVAYHVSGDGDGLLEAGETIHFYGVGGDNIFTGENACWLSKTDGTVSMQSHTRPPPGDGSVTHLPRQVRFEENHLMYEAQRPGTGEDHWFWDKITAPGKADADIELLTLADSPDFQAQLRVGLQGATSSHTTRVSMNGNLLTEGQWEGLAPNVFEASFSQHLLQEGTNIVSVEAVGDGETPDVVYLDWIEVRYDSRLVLADGQLRFSVPANTPGVLVSGLQDQDVLIFDVTEQQLPEFVEGFTTTPMNGSYRVEFGTMADSDRTYVILSSSSAEHPTSIRESSGSSWSGEENGADWIVIAPSAFLDAAGALAGHRGSQGLRTAVVDIQDVYDEFNYAIRSPEAVRTFVRFAYEHWQPPAPRYLLLFGDGHGDYMDWYGTHQPNFILPHYSWIPPLGWAPDDGWFGCVEGDDPLPEVSVGRLPVRSPAEAAAVADKIASYDSVTVPQEWQRRITFCASSGSLFEAICRSMARAAPPNLERLYLFRDDFPDAAGLREGILGSLDAGTFLFFYVGHGSIERWSESCLHVSDVPFLTNAERLPVMCMLTCLAGYFAVPWKESLAEELVRASNGGAAGCIAPTGTGYPSEHWILGEEIMRRFFAGATLGQCLGDAKAHSYARGLSESFLRGFGLLGDPATALRLAPVTPDLLWFY